MSWVQAMQPKLPFSSFYGAVNECLRDESETIKKTRLLKAPPSGTGLSYLGILCSVSQFVPAQKSSYKINESEHDGILCSFKRNNIIRML